MLPLGEDFEGRRRLPAQTWLLAAIILVIGLATGPGQEELQRALTGTFGLIPARLAANPIGAMHTLLTYQLLHGSVMHMATNLLFLWVFGKGLERELRWGYLPFVLLCGVVAGLASVWMRSGSSTPTIGASGAISGILGAYLVLLPNASIRAFVMLPWFWIAALLRGDKPVWDVPAWTAILTWGVLQVAQSVAPEAARSNVDHAAHVGGFLAGYLAIRGARAWLGMWPDEPEYERLLDRPVVRGATLPNSYMRARRVIHPGRPIVREDLEWFARGNGYVDPDAVPGFEGNGLIGRRLIETRYRFEPIRWADLAPVEEVSVHAPSTS